MLADEAVKTARPKSLPPRDSDGYLRHLGERVRNLRAQRGMTRKALAQHAKVSERYLAQLEVGKGNCSIVLLRRIARAIGLPVTQLVHEGAEPALDLVLPYVRERRQFGQPIGEFQLMQGKLADMYTTFSACRAYVYAVGQALDRGETTRKDAAGAILYAAEKATWMAGEAIQCLGGMGYINETPTGRLWRDAKLYEIGAGTSEIRRWLIGRELFSETA